MQRIYNQSQIQKLEQQILKSRSDWESYRDIITHKSIALFNRLRQDFPSNRRVIVFAGPNEKGALAIKLASSLVGMHYSVQLYLLNPLDYLPEIVELEKADYLAESGELIEVTRGFDPFYISEDDLLIDGIQGVEEIVQLNDIVRYLNTLKAIKIALDIPSGMIDGDHAGADFSKVFQADVTYSFYSPKLAFLLPENEAYVGVWSVIQPSYYTDEEEVDSIYSIFDTREMEQAIPRRRKFSHKYDFGKGLLIAGSQGMMGAAVLSGRAAMTSGIGHLTIHVPNGTEAIIHTTLPEALVSIDPSEESFSADDLDLESFQAIAIGPGLGRSMESFLALEMILTSYQHPLILDADALALLAREDGRLLNMIPKGSILTPHTGEFDRLFGPSDNSFQRLEKARKQAIERGVYILLKGAFSATATPEGEVIFNLSGNPGLATAGTGDVLTGIILALFAKKHSAKSACAAGAYLHGFAADIYTREQCEESLTASELINYLPIAFKRFKSDNPSSLYF